MLHRYLVLGLLTESPMSGYAIKKRVCETMSMIASLSYGAVYPTLHRLLQEGAVTMTEVAQEGRPDKKVYSITAQGRAEFEAWLRESAAPDQVKREFLLKVLLAHNLEPQMLKDHLERRRTATETFRQTLEQLQAQPRKQMNAHHSWVIAYALEMCEAEIRWLDEIEQFLPTGEAIDEPISVGSD